MPIAQIIVAPNVVGNMAVDVDTTTTNLKAALVEGLSTDPRLVQVMITVALNTPAGCDTLCLVHHRGSEARTSEIRNATARRLHDILRDSTKSTVRVRLIAVEPSQIASCDSSEALS
ncbi:hypothetical protein ACSBLW_09400 [Thioclava sp. FR2]|uniref:hypothetical protein n=1 Tax=Thioclava sp. FR2 TaxID=3445780 RepID=UPI003EB9C040